MIADALTAYCYNLEVYTGKNGERVSRILGLSTRVVIGLTKEIQNRGHVVYTDNFYTSPLLAKLLAHKGRADIFNFLLESSKIKKLKKIKKS